MVPSAKIGKEITPKRKRRWAHGRVLPNYESPRCLLIFFLKKKNVGASYRPSGLRGVTVEIPGYDGYHIHFDGHTRTLSGTE